MGVNTEGTTGKKETCHQEDAVENIKLGTVVRGGGEYHGGVNGIPVNLNVNITNEIDTIIVTLPIVCSKPMCIENKSTSISFIITPPHTTVSPPPNTALK